MNTHARTQMQRTTHHHHHHFLFTAATQSNTRQSFATKSVVNKRRVNTCIGTLRQRSNKKATQYCPQTVDRGLCRVRSLGTHSEQCSFIKFVNSMCCGCSPYVIAVPLAVHVHGDPMFPRLIGIVGVAHDCNRVRVDDFR